MRTALRTVLLAPPSARTAFDPDTRAYITAAESADGQALEPGVRTALDTFVRGCKADGIWDAIKASCILAGARTLDGALVPLKGTAPTNFNFVSGDYNRKTGLVGDGSTKYLGTNRNNNADPQDNNHNALWVSTSPTGASVIMGVGPVTTETGANNMGRSGDITFTRSRNGTHSLTAAIPSGLTGISRASGSNFTKRVAGSSTLVSLPSQTPRNEIISIFACGATATFKADARVAFYSIGQSLDLALLDARVTTLVNTFASVIP
jgi:hypothetical protein